VDAAVRHPGQADEVEQRLGLRAPLGPRGAADGERVGDVLADGEMREERERLEHHAEVALVGRHAGYVGAPDEDLPCRRRLEPRDQAQQRGLAAARRAEQADEAPARDVQRHAVDGGDAAEALGDAAKGKVVHASSPAGVPRSRERPSAFFSLRSSRSIAG
jgi:hypothetical protein